MGTDSAVRLSVWEVGEFVFCPRAGLIAHRMKFDGEVPFQEDDASYGRLDFLPDYDGVVIERAIADTTRKINRVVLLMVSLATLAYFLHLFAWRGSLWVGVALLLPWPAWLLRMVRYRRELLDYAKLFRDRVPNEPPPDLDRPTEFSWWDFHAAGFRVVKPREPYRDPEFDLVGCPWRILVRGSLRIPVFRKHAGARQAGPPQFATLAAYSHLLRVCETADSPYGVLLFPGTWTVLVVPDRQGAESFRSALDRFRDMLDADRRGQPPDSPASKSPCKGCPHGQPRYLVTDTPATWEWTRSAESEYGTEMVLVREPTIHVIGGDSVRPFAVHGVDGHRYHSLCGDLFEWIPPHDTANRKALQLIPHPEESDDDVVRTVVQAPVQVVVNNVFPTAPSMMPAVYQQTAPSLPPAPAAPVLPGPVSDRRPKPASPPVPPAARKPYDRPRPEPDDDDDFGAGIL